MSTIRLIGFDLDGTLLTPDKTVSRETLDALADCAKRGIMLVPVTGRPLHGIPESVRSIPYLTHLICSNGSMTVDLKTGRILRRKAMPLKLVREILKRVPRENMIREVFIAGYGYHDDVTDTLWKERNLIPAQQIYLKESRRNVRNLDGFLALLEADLEEDHSSFVGNDPDTKGNVSLREPAAEEIDRFRISETSLAEDIYISAHSESEQKEILAHVSDLSEECHIVESFSTDLEFGAVHADKGEALLELAAANNIKVTETAAFGDGGNDIGLLTAAGTAVAMGNSIQKIKNISDFVTEDNQHDGVGKGIRKLLKK